MLPAPGGVSPVHLTDSVSKASYAVGAAMAKYPADQPTRRARRSGSYSDDQPTFALLAEDADDTLFRKVRYSSHHLLHTLLPEQITHPYHLRSRAHSFKLSSQQDERTTSP